MKAAFAHLPPLAPAAVAAAVGISLTVFLLPGAGLQGGPTPLLSVLGSDSGRVAADLPPTAPSRAPARVRTTSFVAQVVATRNEVAAQRSSAAATAHPVHHRSPARIVRSAPAAHASVRAPAAAVAPVAPASTRQVFSTHGKAKGHARGHGHSRVSSPAAKAPAPPGHGHGKALGHSSEHHRVPPGQSKKTPPASPPAPVPPSGNGNGGGKGPKGGKK